MDNKLNNKNKKILIFGIILGVVLIAGGTYAFLTMALNVQNGNVNGKLECFQINYNACNLWDVNGDGVIDTNDADAIRQYFAGGYDVENYILHDLDGDGEITPRDQTLFRRCLDNIENPGTWNTEAAGDLRGTLFPSTEITGGLFGSLAMGVNSACNITGTGTIYLHVGTESSVTLLRKTDGHCENPTTLETLTSYTSSNECLTDGNKWVTDGSALKYAVYDNAAGTGVPLSVGYITGGDIGEDISLYTGFDVNSTNNRYYMFIWLDGNLTNEDYEDLPFSGYIHASVVQK
jgi:hypothetical protein